MHHITSRTNSFYKELKRRLQGRDGLERGQSKPGTAVATLEGIHLCEDWLRHNGQPRHAVFDQRRLRESAELQAMLARLDTSRVVTLDHSLMSGLSPVAKAQGVIYVVDYQTPTIPDVIAHSCIWLDRVQDPGNVGTLLRTAAAAGIKHAYLSRECAGAWSPRVLRGAQGAHFTLTVYEQVDLQEALPRLKVPLYTTALTHAVSLYEAPLVMPCAWVFGNEGQGVASELLEAAQQSVYIPQDGAVESLNVAVAAGICLFEQRRRYKQGI